MNWIYNSLVLTVGAMVIIVPLSLAIALSIGEYLRGRQLSVQVQNILSLISAIPILPFGFGIYLLWRPFPWELHYLIVPTVLLILPFCTYLISKTVLEFPITLRNCGYCLGCSRMQLIFNLMLPYLRNRLLFAYSFMFIKLLSEELIINSIFYYFFHQ